MLSWIVALLAGAVAAALLYGRPPRAAHVLPAMLRFVAVATLVALLLNAPLPAGAPRPPLVALDVSASWLRASDSSALHAALDTALRLGGPDYLFGDTLRAGRRLPPALDDASALASVGDLAAAAGRAVVVITDGELDDGASLGILPSGSRVVQLARRERPDLAVIDVTSPAAVMVNDSFTVRATLRAGAAGSGAGVLTVHIGPRQMRTATLGALAPYGESEVTFTAHPEATEGPTVLRIIATTAGDGEPRNDSVAVPLRLTRAPGAVLVSSAPDLDARTAVAALRGVSALPTRAYFRFGPGRWRAEGTLAPVSESEVVRAVREAPLAVLHGDTALFGSPRNITTHALLLMPAVSTEGDWYTLAPGASPLAASLGGFPIDSLPPISVAPAMPTGDWTALEAHAAGDPRTRAPVLVGWDAPRHIAVLGASGLWRWRARGGVRADAYAALFGALFDWLARVSGDRRGAVPPSGVVRAGERIRWLRGGADSVVTVGLRRDGDAVERRLILTFPGGAGSATSPRLPPGIYRVRQGGGTSMLIVNVSRELLPRRAPALAAPAGAGAIVVSRRGAREAGWIYLLVIVALCTEWLARRRLGQR